MNSHLAKYYQPREVKDVIANMFFPNILGKNSLPIDIREFKMG